MVLSTKTINDDSEMLMFLLRLFFWRVHMGLCFYLIGFYYIIQTVCSHPTSLKEKLEIQTLLFTTNDSMWWLTNKKTLILESRQRRQLICQQNCRYDSLNNPWLSVSPSRLFTIQLWMMAAFASLHLPQGQKLVTGLQQSFQKKATISQFKTVYSTVTMNTEVWGRAICHKIQRRGGVQKGKAQSR